MLCGARQWNSSKSVEKDQQLVSGAEQKEEKTMEHTETQYTQLLE